MELKLTIYLFEQFPDSFKLYLMELKRNTPYSVYMSVLFFKLYLMELKQNDAIPAAAPTVL